MSAARSGRGWGLSPGSARSHIHETHEYRNSPESERARETGESRLYFSERKLVAVVAVLQFSEVHTGGNITFSGLVR